MTNDGLDRLIADVFSSPPHGPVRRSTAEACDDMYMNLDGPSRPPVKPEPVRSCTMFLRPDLAVEVERIGDRVAVRVLGSMLGREQLGEDLLDRNALRQLKAVLA